MKKPKLKKKYIPKYQNGGGVYNPSDPNRDNEEFIDPSDTNDGKSNNLSTGQYIGAGTALVGGGTNMYQTYNNPNSSYRQKSDSFDNTARATTTSISPVIGGVIGIGDTIGKPIRNNLEATDPETGKVKNRQAVKTGAAAGMFFDPGKWTSELASGNFDMSGNKYVDRIESDAQGNIANKQAQQDQQNAYQTQQNQLMKDSIQQGISGYFASQSNKQQDPLTEQEQMQQHYYKYGGVTSDKTAIHAPELGGYFRRKQR